MVRQKPERGETCKYYLLKLQESDEMERAEEKTFCSWFSKSRNTH